MSRLIKSVIGSFAARVGLSLVEFLGVLYVATAAGAATLGVYVLFRAVSVIASMLIDLGVGEAAKKRIAERRDQGEFLSASILLRLVFLVPIVLGILLFRSSLESYVGSRYTVPFLLLSVVLELFVASVYAGLHGEQRVGRAEFSLFVNVVGKVAVWAVLLPLGYGLLGLLIGLVVGRGLQLVVGIWFLSIRPRIPDRRHFESLLRFSRYSWLGIVRERAWVWTDTVVLGLFVTAELIGVYELSWQLSAALFLAASVISSILFANLDDILERQGRQAVSRAIEQSLVYTGIVAVPGLVGVIVLGQSLLASVGPVYTVGYPVLLLLVFARLAHCYEIVFAKAISGFDRPELVFRVDATFITLNVVGNLVGIATVGWVGAAIATALSMIVRTLLSYHYLASILEVRVPRREIAMEVFAAIVMGVFLLSVTGGRPLDSLEALIAVGAGGIVYFATLYTTVGWFRVHVRSLITSLT